MGRVSIRHLLALAAALAGMAVLVSLGVWQLHRLEWKEALIDKIDAEADIDPRMRPLDDLLGGDHNFARGYLKGEWMRDQTVLVGPKLREEAWGYWNITPLKLDDGRIILVNRGWGEGEIKTPRHAVTVMGSLRESDRGGKPVAGDTRRWHKLDTQAIARALHLQAVPTAMFMEYSDPLDLAKPAPIAVNLRNMHMQYAIFWFAMAGVLLIVFVAASLRGRRSASSPDPSDP